MSIGDKQDSPVHEEQSVVGTGLEGSWVWAHRPEPLPPHSEAASAFRAAAVTRNAVIATLANMDVSERERDVRRVTFA